MPIRISDIFSGANTADLVEKEWLPAMGFPSDTSSGLIHVAQATGVVSGDTYIPGDAVHYVDGGWLRFGSAVLPNDVAGVLPNDAAGVLTNDGAGALTWETPYVFDASADRTITGEWSFDISGGKSFVITDDPTMDAPTILDAISDHVISPTALIKTVTYSNSVGGNGAAIDLGLNDDGSVLYSVGLNDGVRVASDITELNGAGTSSRSIEVQTLNVDAEVNVDISGGKSFIVSDDITLASPLILMGVLDHNATINPTSVLLENTGFNTAGGNIFSNTAILNDDGSIAVSTTLNDGVAVSSDVTTLNGAGTSARDITVDTLRINISSGESFIVTDDDTTPNKYFGIFDEVDLPSTSIGNIHGHNTYIYGDDVIGSYWSYEKLTSTSGYTSVAKNVNGQCVEVGEVTAAGVSTKSITADTITLTGATVLSQDPVIALGVATKQYVDYQTESALTSSGGVVAINVSTSENLRRISLTENVTSWSFTNRPASGKYRDIYIEITQDAVTDYTVTLPTGDKVAGGPWVMPPTLGASVTVGVRIGNTTTKWFPAGEDYTI